MGSVCRIWEAVSWEGACRDCGKGWGEVDWPGAGRGNDGRQAASGGHVHPVEPGGQVQARHKAGSPKYTAARSRFEVPVRPLRRIRTARWASGTINPMKPSDSFRVHRKALREIIARHGVTRPRIFGSAALGEDHEGSDLDLLVEPASSTTLFTLAALQIEAERLLGVPVDVLTPKSLPRGSRERILREAVPV